MCTWPKRRSKIGGCPLFSEKMHEAIAHYEDRFEMPTEDECDELVIVRLED